jgi:hypothetical protein
MGSAVACRFAAIGIGHAYEIVGRRRLVVDRLEHAEHHVHAVPLCGCDHRGGGVERHRHPPRPGIGLREADEIHALGGGGGNVATASATLFSSVPGR